MDNKHIPIYISITMKRRRNGMHLWPQTTSIKMSKTQKQTYDLFCPCWWWSWRIYVAVFKYIIYYPWFYMALFMIIIIRILLQSTSRGKELVFLDTSGNKQKYVTDINCCKWNKIYWSSVLEDNNEKDL